jgi:hypothetical protein
VRAIAARTRRLCPELLMKPAYGLALDAFLLTLCVAAGYLHVVPQAVVVCVISSFAGARVALHKAGANGAGGSGPTLPPQAASPESRLRELARVSVAAMLFVGVLELLLHYRSAA